jgi:anti-anti-sigma regulatory factor
MAVLGNGLDITERKRSEKERTRLHESIIQEQAASLRELSTPLIPLSRRIVAMPLIGRIDSGRAQQIMDVLLQGIADHQATTAILDITGVPIVDNRVATVLLEAAQAVRLLGAQVILTGIRPDVAQSLVSLDMQLTDIVTRGSLQAGIAYALGRHLD